MVPVELVHSAQGKDFSNHNGQLGSGDLKGLNFAIFKATEGTGFTDVDFKGSWALAKKLGLHRGAYHFFHPSIDPVAQAKFFVNTVKAQGLEPGDMLAADVEITSGLFRRMFNVSHKPGDRNDLAVLPAKVSLVNSSARKFLDTVKSLVPSSNPILVYSNLSVGSHLSLCTGYPLWIAFPSSTAPSNVSPWKHWLFWQWGTSGGVDADAFNGTSTDFQNWLNSFAGTKPEVTEVVANGTETMNQLSDASLNKRISTILRMTLQHNGSGLFSTPLSDYIQAGNWNAAIPAGEKLWYNK